MADFWAEAVREGESCAIADGDLLRAANDFTPGVFTIGAFLAEDLTLGVVMGGALAVGVPAIASDLATGLLLLGV